MINLPVIYICAPYRSDSEWELVQNIRRAETMALNVWRIGGVALCPHKNTAHFGGYSSLEDKVWLNGDMELLARCDAMFCEIPYETASRGMLQEIEFCMEHNIPILKTLGAVEVYIEGFLVTNYAGLVAKDATRAKVARLGYKIIDLEAELDNRLDEIKELKDTINSLEQGIEDRDDKLRTQLKRIPVLEARIRTLEKYNG